MLVSNRLNAFLVKMIRNVSVITIAKAVAERSIVFISRRATPVTIIIAM